MRGWPPKVLREPKKTEIEPGEKIRTLIALGPELDAAQWRFVEQYMLTMDVKVSAESAGYAPSDGWRVLQNKKVQRALTMARAFRSSRTAIYQDYVLKRWLELASFDANDIVELRLVACRYCHGEEFRYQRTLNEFRKESEEHKRLQQKLHPDDASQRTLFDVLGGDGYRTDLVPNLECPECSGNGIPLPVFKDSRHLRGGARIAYQGVEVTPNGGFKLKLRNPEFAETMVAKHLGMLNDRDPIRPVDPTQLTDAELESVLDDLPPLLREQIDAAFERLDDDPRPIEDAEIIEDDDTPAAT